MQFTKENAEKVMAGTKTQTRRACKDNERYENGLRAVYVWNPEIGLDGLDWIKWQVGRTYAVCPGRGKPAVGRIRLLEIRKEKLWDIGEEDAMSEGIQCPGGEDGLYFAVWSAIPEFVQLWDSINPKGKRWAYNPDVWVLTFEVVQ